MSEREARPAADPEVEARYQDQLALLLRRRALTMAAIIGVVMLIAMLLALSSLLTATRAALVRYVEDQAVAVLRWVEGDLPSSVLTEPLETQEAALQETQVYLQRTVEVMGLRRLVLIRAVEDGSYAIVLDVVRVEGAPPRVYSGLPAVLPFDPQSWGNRPWYGELLEEEDRGGGIHTYLPVYLPVVKEGKLLGLLKLEYPLVGMENVLDQSWSLGMLIALASVLIVMALGWWVTHRTLSMVRVLALPADNIIKGDLSRRHPIQGTPMERPLFEFANQVADLLETRIHRLEEEIASARQAMERRASYLAATAQVGRVASTILDVDRLLDESAHLIARYFGFYHVGLFLVDDSRNWAVLRAASSEGGKRMLARKHRLQLGQGVVGYAAQTGRPRIASDVDVDVVWVPNPDLPETRSEMAVPMSVRGEIIGVLDVQSTEPSAFTAEDVATLRVLAGQLAVAIENARLFRQSSVALEEARSLRMEEVARGWQRWRQNLYGYRYDAIDSYPITAPLEGLLEATRVQVERSTNTIVAPLIWGGFVIGHLRITREPSRPWNVGEVELVKAAAIDISQALENARLVEETRERARVERVINQVAAQLESLREPDSILQRAILELGASLDIEYAMLELVPAKASGDTGEGTVGKPQEGGSAS